MPRAVSFNPLLRRTSTNGDTPPAHPGEILRVDYMGGADAMSDADLSAAVAHLANRIEWPVEKLAAVVAERQDITPDLAWRLGEFLGTSARYWLALQLQYDLWHDETRSHVSRAPAIDCAH